MNPAAREESRSSSDFKENIWLNETERFSQYFFDILKIVPISKLEADLVEDYLY